MELEVVGLSKDTAMTTEKKTRKSARDPGSTYITAHYLADPLVQRRIGKLLAEFCEAA